jgi:DNA-directed RNA polymerase specialized sigma24 family protein
MRCCRFCSGHIHRAQFRGSLKLLPQILGQYQASIIGKVLESCRSYLLAIAMAELPGDLHGMLVASELVQETLVKGVEPFGTFQGHTPEELAGWLRRILLNPLANARDDRAFDRGLLTFDEDETGLRAPLTFTSEWKSSLPLPTCMRPDRRNPR